MVFRALSVAVALALGGLMLYVGEPNRPSWWAGVLPFVPWVIGPAVAPYLIAARQSRRWLCIAMFLYLTASSILSGFVYHDAFFRSDSSTAALAMVFVPLYQWLALALMLLICLSVVAFLTRRGRVT